MRTEKKITTPVFATISLAAGLALITSQTLAGDFKSQRPLAATGGSTMKFGNRATDPKPPLPARPAGLRSGDQIDLIYDARTKGYTFGRIVEIRKASQPSQSGTATTVHDHRGKTSTRAPNTPPGAPPPAAPPTPVSGPPAAPPGTIPVPPASGNVVRTHDKDVYPDITNTRVKDHREGYGGDTYEQRSFRTVTGMTVTVKPRQKPPCFGDACWFFR